MGCLSTKSRTRLSMYPLPKRMTSPRLLPAHQRHLHHYPGRNGPDRSRSCLADPVWAGICHLGDALSVSPGGESQVAVAADGSQVELLAGEDQSEAKLSLVLDGTEHSTSFSVTRAEVGSGTAVSLSANADTGMMVYENGSGASGNYQPRVTLVGENGYQFFVNRSVEIPPNAAHAYDTASWFGPEAMTVQMDQNGDGTFETTTQVENDASYLFFPLVTEKRPIFWRSLNQRPANPNRPGLLRTLPHYGLSRHRRTN